MRWPRGAVAESRTWIRSAKSLSTVTMPGMVAGTAADRIAAYRYRIAFSDVIGEIESSREVDDSDIAIVISIASITGAGAGSHS